MQFRTSSARPRRCNAVGLITGLAVAVITTACSSSPAAPAISSQPASSGSGALSSGADAVSSGAGALSGAAAGAGALTTPTEPPSSTGGTNSAYDPSRTVALPMSIRVVNLYLPKGSNTGGPIEVWNGTPAAGGKKLQTVPYGQASAFFAPQVSDPAGQGVSGPNVDYSLSFYAPGHTGADDKLMNQGEKSAPGQKLTFVASTSNSSSTGMSMLVFTDELGGTPQGSGFSTVSLPPPPAGTALISLNATALEDRSGGTSGSVTGLTPSTVKGTCIAYLDPDTNKIHDMASDTIDMFGGTSSRSYPMQPGAAFRVNRLKDQQSIADACADTPVAGPFQPGLTAGERAYGLFYGAALASMKLLVLPVG